MTKHILPVALGLFMFMGVYMHFVTPEVSDGFIPAFLPKTPVHILAGITEAIIGVALIVPKYRRYGGLFFALLCLAFLPLHLWDLVRPDPVITPMRAAIIRVIVQLAFIFAGYRIWKRTPAPTT